MRLIGENGDQVELEVTGYQFPHIEDDEWDSNWLNIKVNATVDERSWTSHDPSLLTFDLEALASWLEAVADGKRVERELEFMEPNLAFQLDRVGTAVIDIRVWFECESRPAWRQNPVAGARDLAASLSLPAAELRTAAADLRSQLQRFPTRVPLQAG